MSTHCNNLTPQYLFYGGKQIEGGRSRAHLPLSVVLDVSDDANKCRSFLRPSRLFGGRGCLSPCVNLPLRSKHLLLFPPAKVDLILVKLFRFRANWDTIINGAV